MRRRRLIPPAVILLALLATAAPAASLNGHDVATLARTAPAATRRNTGSGAVLLLPAGLSAIASEAHEDGLTLDQWFAGQGLVYLGNIGPDAALVQVTAGPPPSGRDKRLAGLLPLADEARIDRDLLAFSKSISASGEVPLVVHAAGSTATLESALAADCLVSPPVIRGASTRLGLRVPAGRLAAVIDLLSQDPAVYTVQAGGGARLFNVTARRIVQSATTATGGETLWQRGLHGQGQVIAVLDTGADPLNCFLAESDAGLPPVVMGTGTGSPDTARRKIIIYDMLYSGDNPASGLGAYESQGHGTAVSGCALGASLADPLGAGDTVRNGVAPAAKLVMQDGGHIVDNCSDLQALGCPVIDLTPILEQAWQQGARIHNNSWGDNENAVVYPQRNIYTAASADVDDITWQHPDFLVVCAAGNDGALGDNTVSSPGTAKNAISAAGTQNPGMNTMATFSSRGWASDGRIKPDLSAPASATTAGWNNGGVPHCTTITASGTSFASPYIAACAALVRQYFAEGWHPGGAPNPADAMPSPSAALVKAVLLAGASPVATETALPSRRQGWGRIHLENSLHFSGGTRRLIAVDGPATFNSAADPGYSLTFTSTAAAGSGDLRIALVYTDYPATAGASPALVNDLHLEVALQSGAVYLGNQINTTTSLSQTGGTPDTLNNVEMVRLAPTADTFTVTVEPATILQPGQTFALVVLGDAVLSPPAGVGEIWRVE